MLLLPGAVNDNKYCCCDELLVVDGGGDVGTDGDEEEVEVDVDVVDDRCC